MTFLGWMGLAGVVLLVMGLTSAQIKRLPISGSLIYLALGVAAGPAAFGLINLDLVDASGWLERVTEVAVIVSLFVGGLKLRLAVRDPAWRPAIRLAAPILLVTILGVALFTHLWIGMSLGAALLLGAVLSPTDPVLASAVSVNDAADHDRMRYGLSGEAGLNDGLAFPFVVFALRWSETGGAGAWIWRWVAVDLLWAVPAALALGYGMGRGMGHLAIWVRSRERDVTAPNDLFALALIALTYVGAELAQTWGFLAVFAAGVGLRHAEISVVGRSPHPGQARDESAVDEAAETRAAASDAEAAKRKTATREPARMFATSAATTAATTSVPASAVAHPPAEHLVSASEGEEALGEPAIAAGVLVAETISFGSTAERLLEFFLVTVVGVCLIAYWDVRAMAVALALFVVIRPLTVFLLLAGTETTRPQRALMGWFGIRGIGSLYYLTYALDHGLSGADAPLLASLTVSVVALSVLVHGATAQAFLSRYEASLSRS